MKIVAQDGSPLPVEHLISYVNFRVEVRGREAGNTFRLLGIASSNRQSFPTSNIARPPHKTANPRSFSETGKMYVPLQTAATA